MLVILAQSIADRWGDAASGGDLPYLLPWLAVIGFLVWNVTRSGSSSKASSSPSGGRPWLLYVGVAAVLFVLVSNGGV